jgi:hypothetical protein
MANLYFYFFNSIYLNSISFYSCHNHDEIRSIQDRLAALTATQKQQQQQQQQQQSNIAKRFKPEQETTQVSSSSTSSYLQQKSELEAREGRDKGDDSSKWLVR